MYIHCIYKRRVDEGKTREAKVKTKTVKLSHNIWPTLDDNCWVFLASWHYAERAQQQNQKLKPTAC